jgi:hypothetical protein
VTISHPLVQRNVHLKRYIYAILCETYQVVCSSMMCLDVTHLYGLISCLMAQSVVHIADQ